MNIANNFMKTAVDDIANDLLQSLDVAHSSKKAWSLLRKLGGASAKSGQKQLNC